MKRRGFLQTIVGIVGAAVAGLKVKAAPAPPPAPALVSIDEYLSGVRFVPDYSCPPDRMYFFCSREQIEAYKRLGYDMAHSKFEYLVNNDSKVWQGISRASYPELK